MRNRANFLPNPAVRAQAVAAAEAILDGRLGIIEGGRQLADLSHSLVEEGAADPDLVVFISLDSDTDSLPVGKDRERWDPTALVEQDAAVKEAEDWWRSQVEAACRNVMRRFADV